MLVLTRSKRAPEIILAGGIRILVLDVRGSDVRLGIDAPADTKILRGEHRDAAELREVSAVKSESEIREQYERAHLQFERMLACAEDNRAELKLRPALIDAAAVAKVALAWVLGLGDCPGDGMLTVPELFDELETHVAERIQVAEQYKPKVRG